MIRGRHALSLAAALSLGGGIIACAARVASQAPDPRRATNDAGRAPELRAIAEIEAVPDAAPRALDAALVTTGSGPAVVARRTAEPSAPTCAKEQRAALTFDQTPIYSEKIDKGAAFSARLWIGSAASCTRKIALPLSFTPPRSTTTRTIDFVAYVPPRGAFVDLRLDGDELTEANVSPGRYAITFAVLDEDGRPVGRALSGNPFRLGRDDVEIASAPSVPARIGAGDDLVVRLELRNLGDTANRVTPLIAFTRPGATAGIEHYAPPELVVPGAASYTIRLSREAREAAGVGPGSWLVTVTAFDAGGDRLSSYAGMPLTIGRIDLRMTRPVLPVHLSAHEALRALFELENRGDTPDKVSTVVAFTKPGTAASKEFVFTREIPPGRAAFEAVIDPAARRDRGVGEGVWLVTTAAFRSNGERIKSFAGHYLEITGR